MLTGFDHFCLTVDSNDIGAVRKELEAAGAVAEQQFDGVVVQRFGAQGTASSIYIRDPGWCRQYRIRGWYLRPVQRLVCVKLPDCGCVSVNLRAA